MVSASRFKCDVTVSGGRCRSQLFREKVIYSLALNISRNTKSAWMPMQFAHPTWLKGDQWRSLLPLPVLPRTRAGSSAIIDIQLFGIAFTSLPSHTVT
jgi:hypothetical protein